MTPQRMAQVMRAVFFIFGGFLLLVALPYFPILVWLVAPTQGNLDFMVAWCSVWGGAEVTIALCAFYAYIRTNDEWPWRAMIEGPKNAIRDGIDW